MIMKKQVLALAFTTMIFSASPAEARTVNLNSRTPWCESVPALCFGGIDWPLSIGMTVGLTSVPIFLKAFVKATTKNARTYTTIHKKKD